VDLGSFYSVPLERIIAAGTPGEVAEKLRTAEQNTQPESPRRPIPKVHRFQGPSTMALCLVRLHVKETQFLFVTPAERLSDDHRDETIFDIA
jgi:hypothetical protein